LIARADPCEVLRPPEFFMPRYDLGPKPQLGYTASILARVAERRSDDEGRYRTQDRDSAQGRYRAKDRGNAQG